MTNRYRRKQALHAAQNATELVDRVVAIALFKMNDRLPASVNP
jgi:hypothetical protein